MPNKLKRHRNNYDIYILVQRANMFSRKVSHTKKSYDKIHEIDICYDKNKNKYNNGHI